MNEIEAYNILLVERQCNRSRLTCNCRCSSCNLYNRQKTDEAINLVLNKLKNQNPELHFIDDIERLRMILDQGDNL